MKRIGVRILFALMFFNFGCHRNNSTRYTEPPALTGARQELATAISSFNACLATGDLDLCIATLTDTTNTNTAWKRFVIAETLYAIEPQLSFRFHKAAFKDIPTDPFVKLWYAIELHRNRDFAGAAPLYEDVVDALTYYSIFPEDGNVMAKTLLSDCLLHMDQPQRSEAIWSTISRPFTNGIKASSICRVYAPSDKIRKRNSWRRNVQRADASDAFKLLYHDIHWEDAQWGYGQVQKDFLQEDLKLIKENETKIAAAASLEAYASIMKYMGLLADKTYVDSVKRALKSQKWIVNDNPLPENAAIAADLLNICFIEKIVPAKEFADARKDEIVRLAGDQKNARLLKIYTWWAEMDPKNENIEVAKLGWMACNDESFAVRYLKIKAGATQVVYDETLRDVRGLSYNDPELAKALADFPGSAKLQWIKVNCAYNEKRPIKADLIEAVKRGFTWRSDDAYCLDATRSLDRYYRYLYNELESLRQPEE